MADRVNSNPGGAATNVPGADTGFGGDLMAEIQKSLMASSGITSSDNSGLEKVITGAIDATRKAGESTRTRIEGTYNRDIEQASMEGAASLNTAQEERRGFATVTAGLANLLQTSDKRVKDLEQRKQESLLMADAETAKMISDLQVKEYEIQQQAQQKTFERLLGMGNFATQVSQEERLSKSANFEQSQTIANIALKYGLQVSPNETIDSITAKAMPYASEEQKLELAQARANIAKTNAETTKALNGDSSSKSDDITIMGIAAAARINPSVLSTLKDPVQSALVISKMDQLETSEIESKITEYKNSGLSRNQIMKKLQSDPTIVIQSSGATLAKIGALTEKVYGSASAPATSPASTKSSPVKVTGAKAPAKTVPNDSFTYGKTINLSPEAVAAFSKNFQSNLKK